MSSTSGRPYLGTSTAIFDWPKGALEHRVDLALHRGVVIRGKVVEEGTGRPVAGARISFGTRRKDEPNGASSGHAESGQDGSFQLAVLPSPGYLIVLAPSEDSCTSRSAARWSARVGRAAGGSTPMPSSPTTPSPTATARRSRCRSAAA